MDRAPDISDTAFITCYFRSLDPELSRDPLASLWVDSAVARLGDKFRHEVIENDPVNIQLRCRYWVEALERFQAAHGEVSLVNLGAGFSMYPFLPCLRETSLSLEVDQSHVVAFKRARLAEFARDGRVPAVRHLAHRALDFEREPFEALLDEELAKLGRDRPTFFLLEGFFYYLSPPVSDRLWGWLRSACTAGDRIGMIHLPQEIRESAAYRRTQRFLQEDCGYDGEAIVYHEREYFSSEGLEVLDQSSHVGLARRYGASEDHTNDNTFNEHFLLLEAGDGP